MELCFIAELFLEVRDKSLQIAPCNGLQGAVAQYTANQTLNDNNNITKHL